MNNPKILIINPFGIGDVIFSTPLIGAIKKNYPESYIGYICNKRAYEIIKSNPDLSRIFIYEKDEYRTAWQCSRIECLKKIWGFLNLIRKERFDTVIDLSLGYQYSLLLKLIGVRRRLGFNYRKRGKFLTDKVDIDGFSDKHVIEYYLDMLRPLGIDPAKCEARPKVYLTEKDALWADHFLKDNGVSGGDLVMGAIPGCGASWGVDAKCRRWDKEKFAKVCDTLIDLYGAKVILFGDPKETEICAGIQKMMAHEAIISCGKTSLGYFLGLLNRCRVVITNDGGPLHMAVGLGVNTVSVFGPVDEKIYGPYPQNAHHIVISRNDVACRPCYKKFKYTICEKRICLENIRPEEVLAAVKTLMPNSSG